MIFFDAPGYLTRAMIRFRCAGQSNQVVDGRVKPGHDD